MARGYAREGRGAVWHGARVCKGGARAPLGMARRRRSGRAGGWVAACRVRRGEVPCGDANPDGCVPDRKNVAHELARPRRCRRCPSERYGLGHLIASGANFTHKGSVGCVPLRLFIGRRLRVGSRDDFGQDISIGLQARGCRRGAAGAGLQARGCRRGAACGGHSVEDPRASLYTKTDDC